MVSNKINLLGCNTAEIGRLIKPLGEPAFRAKQISEWIYEKGARDFSQMTNLSAKLRELLDAKATIARSEIALRTDDRDGTSKFLLKLEDDHAIECVLLPYEDRTSICVSSQVGCKARCAFCATGDSGFVRNLTAGEIVDQALTMQEVGGKRVSHVVFMGMGEPLLNFDNVVAALHLLNDEVGISMRRITLSTIGIVPGINKLADLDLQLTLAVSLHAPDDSLRQRLIPFAKRNPLKELIPACKEYSNKTGRRVTFEYMLLQGVNDTPGHAVRLARLVRGMMCHINLIPYNDVPGKDFKRPDKGAITTFKNLIEREGIEVTQRFERGASASAACGQLRRQTKENEHNQHRKPR